MLNGIELVESRMSNGLIKTHSDDEGKMLVRGRDLHVFLEIATPYLKWINRMIEYGFSENEDFAVTDIFVHDDKIFGGKRKAKDHIVNLDMAKEICMIQRSEKGKMARQYFLSIERMWNSPEMVMKRALEYANQKVLTLQNKIEEQKPKVLLAESIENSDSLILVRDLAKILKQSGCNIGQNRLFERLRNLGYLIKGGSSKNLPTQRSMDLGLFRLVEGTRTSSGGIKITKTTKVTGKGQKYFVGKFLGGNK